MATYSTLVDYSPGDHKELDRTECVCPSIHTHTHTHTHTEANFIGLNNKIELTNVLSERNLYI